MSMDKNNSSWVTLKKVWKIIDAYRMLLIGSLVLAGGLTLHGTVLSRRVPGGELVWYVLAILVGIAYLLLTVGAPDIGPFADPAAAAMGTIPF